MPFGFFTALGYRDFNLYFHGHFILHRAFQRKQNKRIWLRYRVLVVYGSNLRWVVLISLIVFEAYPLDTFSLLQVWQTP